MRRPALSLLIAALLLTVGSVPASAASKPRSANAFVDSIGVNVHMTYKDTAYANRDRLIRKLAESGIRQVRDGLSYDTQYAYDSFNQLAARGIKTTFIMGDPTESRDTLEELMSTLRTKVPAAAEAVEGPNEYSRSGRRNWPAELRAYQSRLFGAIKRDGALRRLPVLAPSLVTWQDHAQLGALDGSAEFGNKHSYPGGDLPEDNVTEELATAARMTGNRATYVTESGYHNALNSSDGHLPTSEQAAATYLPRMFLEYFRRGIPRTFTYELIDEWRDAGKRNLESNFGLLRNDYSEKPAYKSLTNLISVLQDRSGKVTPRSLRYRLEGAPGDLRQLVLQKSDGSHYLVLWRATRVWDPKARRAIAPDTRSMTVNLNAGARTRLYAPVRSRRAYASTSRTSIPLRLAADPVVVRVSSPRASARKVAVPSGQRLRTVLKRGLRVRLEGLQGASVRLEARHNARLLGRMSTAPRAALARTVRLRPTRAGRKLMRRALAKRRGLVVTVRARLGKGATASQVVRVRLRR